MAPLVPSSIDHHCPLKRKLLDRGMCAEEASDRSAFRSPPIQLLDGAGAIEVPATGLE
jgi:hypothetical protein